MGRIVIAILAVCFAGKIAAMEADCDLVGSNMDSSKAKSKQSCQEDCQSQEACRGAVFISGLGKCFLKKTVKRQVKVVMSSALANEAMKDRYDFSGKDIRSIVSKTKEACVAACSLDKSCRAATYIGGYQTCWLKQEKGKFYSKVFFLLSETQQKGQLGLRGVSMPLR